MTVPCSLCGDPLDPNSPGVFRKVEGWVQARAQGGVNGITFRKELGEYAHDVCVELQRRDINANQGAMF